VRSRTPKEGRRGPPAPKEGKIPHAGSWGGQGCLASDCSGDPRWPVGPSAQSHLSSPSLRAPGRAWAGLGSPLSRRSLALADDAAFRERARLLAALERRRWLDSYMQKLLLLDAP
jgi:hypothetical protein